MDKQKEKKKGEDLMRGANYKKDCMLKFANKKFW